MRCPGAYQPTAPLASLKLSFGQLIKIDTP
jgi:hypothetical protein